MPAGRCLSQNLLILFQRIWLIPTHRFPGSTSYLGQVPGKDPGEDATEKLSLLLSIPVINGIVKNKIRKTLGLAKSY